VGTCSSSKKVWELDPFQRKSGILLVRNSKKIYELAGIQGKSVKLLLFKENNEFAPLQR
jgi:hypothetical protein